MNKKCNWSDTLKNCLTQALITLQLGNLAFQASIYSNITLVMDGAFGYNTNPTAMENTSNLIQCGWDKDKLK